MFILLFAGLINKVVNGKSGAAFCSDAQQLLSQASSLRAEDMSSPVVLRLYAHVRLFPLVANKIIDMMNEDDRKIVEVYDTAEGLLKLLLSVVQQSRVEGFFEVFESAPKTAPCLFDQSILRSRTQRLSHGNGTS